MQLHLSLKKKIIIIIKLRHNLTFQLNVSSCCPSSWLLSLNTCKYNIYTGIYQCNECKIPKTIINLFSISTTIFSTYQKLMTTANKIHKKQKMHILMKIYIRHLQSKWKKRRKKIKDTGETNRCSYLHIQYSLAVQIQWTQIIVTDYAGNYMAWSNNSLVQANENITWGGRVEGYTAAQEHEFQCCCYLANLTVCKWAHAWT